MPINIPTDVTEAERAEIERLLTLVGTADPTLEQIWQCMDAVWDELGCDNRNIDAERIGRFYRHPVWLLNGLFVEQHELSMWNRDVVSNWVAARGIHRVADFGGGFGTLGRMIADKCPSAEVEIIDPFGHPLAMQRAAEFPNLSYRKDLSGQYDIIIAMDVFEHVEDPLGLMYKTARNIRNGGFYLTANCFYPVIKCHLPCAFHFRRSWKLAALALSLRHAEDVSYGSAFCKAGNGSLLAARAVEYASISSFAASEWVAATRSRLKLRTRLVGILARLTH